MINTRKDVEAERFATVARIVELPADRRAELIEEYRRRSEAAFAPSTIRNYRSMLRLFKAWCDEHGHPSVPPIPPTVVASYVDHLGGQLRASTIETRLWAIGEWHKSHFLPSPCQHRLVELAVKGVKRTYGASTDQASPLGKAAILQIISSLGDSRIELRDKALLWVASDSWCRSSELVAFRVRDLSIQDDGSGLLYITRSKTDQYGEGAYGYLSKPGAVAVRRWIDCARLGLNDPLFTKSQPDAARSPLDPATISRVFKKRTGRHDVSAHSTRVGGVQDALRLGCDLSSIMVAGRWASPEMPARYGRRILASQSAAATVAQAFLAQSPEGQEE